MDEKEIARKLHAKIVELFPEFEPFLSEDEEDNATVTLIDLLDSLERVHASPADTELLDRIREFRNWVETQPRGQNVNDDVLTWYCVTFVEGVLERENLFHIAPAVISREELVENKDYFYTWIGATEYHRVLSVFPEQD